MRHLRQLCCAFALACLLAPAALADDGIMHPQSVPPPSVTGSMQPQDPVDETQAATNAALAVALDLINMLSRV